MQDAIDAGEPTRDPRSGHVFSSPGMTIEQDDGDEPVTREQERWAEALAVPRMHGERASTMS